MPQTRRRRVFVSFHHEDQRYKDEFVRMMGDRMIDESVDIGDIPQNIAVDTIRRDVRDKFIRRATVTVVLVGPCTWQRKHVDWEIGSSLRATKLNSRCGLLGILLPNHPNFGDRTYGRHLIPPRLADNCDGNNPYAHIYNWNPQANKVREWIDKAFKRRDGTPPKNSSQQFRRNRSGDCSRGWE